jgi:hypothetical protein
MAGSEQRPEDVEDQVADDTEGHGGGRWSGQDTEAVDEDKVGEDAEGNAAKFKF